MEISVSRFLTPLITTLFERCHSSFVFCKTHVKYLLEGTLQRKQNQIDKRIQVKHQTKYEYNAI